MSPTIAHEMLWHGDTYTTSCARCGTRDERKPCVVTDADKLKIAVSALEQISSKSWDDKDEANYPIKRWARMPEVIDLAREALKAIV